MKTAFTTDLKKSGIAALGGLMLTAAFPKIEMDGLAWAALVPLLWTLGDASLSEAFRRGLSFGIAHFLTLLYWLVPTMVTYGHLPLALSIAILFLFASILSALFVAPAAVGIHLAARTPARLFIGFPIVWVGAEFLRSFLFTGFPWALLGYSQYRQLHLIQVSDILGVYGISGLIAAANAALFLGVCAVLNRPWQGRAVTGRLAVGSLAAAAMFAAAVWGYGDRRIREVDRLASQGRPALRVGLVQGNIEQSQKWDPAFQLATIETYNRLSLSLRPKSPDLIVWPESAAPFYFPAEAAPTRLVLQGVRAVGAFFLIGAPSFELRGRGADYFNSAFLVGPTGEVLGKYDKAHLVPYGEYTPFKAYLPFLGKIVEHVGDFTPGVRGQTLLLKDRRLGVQICYEIIFPALSRAMVRNGADLLVTITNDAWYGTSAGPYQHFSLAVLRAVENRRALARAANTGISGFVDPAGRVLDPTPLMTEAVVVRDLPLSDIATVYTRYGDVFAAVCLAGTLGIAAAELFRRRLGRNKAGG